jgi:hypothetical protein
MIDNLEILNHPGVLKIAALFKNLKYVAQVRWYKTIRPHIVDTYETSNVVCFNCMVEDIKKPGRFLNTLAYVPESVYNAPSDMSENFLLANTIMQVSNTIDEYRKTGDETCLNSKTLNITTS